MASTTEKEKSKICNGIAISDFQYKEKPKNPKKTYMSERDLLPFKSGRQPSCKTTNPIFEIIKLTSGLINIHLI